MEAHQPASAALMPIATEDEVLTVEAAWMMYDLQEREMWDEYAEDPTYVNGKVYLAGEQLIRRRCEHTVRRLRYQLSEGEAGACQTTF